MNPCDSQWHELGYTADLHLHSIFLLSFYVVEGPLFRITNYEACISLYPPGKSHTLFQSYCWRPKSWRRHDDIFIVLEMFPGLSTSWRQSPAYFDDVSTHNVRYKWKLIVSKVYLVWSHSDWSIRRLSHSTSKIVGPTIDVWNQKQWYKLKTMIWFFKNVTMHDGRMRIYLRGESWPSSNFFPILFTEKYQCGIWWVFSCWSICSSCKCGMFMGLDFLEFSTLTWERSKPQQMYLGTGLSILVYSIQNKNR